MCSDIPRGKLALTSLHLSRNRWGRWGTTNDFVQLNILSLLRPSQAIFSTDVWPDGIALGTTCGGKSRERLLKNEDEWTGKAEFRKEEILGSRRSMHDYTQTHLRLSRDSL